MRTKIVKSFSIKDALEGKPTQLIKVTEQNGMQAISARELHEFLQIQKPITQWFEYQIERAMLVENEDFITILLESTGGRPSKDYAISINAAKEIAMLNGGEKGKQARQYFIECEKQLKKPKTQIEIILESAKLLAEMERKQIQLEQRIELIEAKPEINGVIQHFSILGYCCNIGKQISLEMAKDYGKKCSSLCTQLGFQTGKVPDSRFGTVKTYPLNVLEEIIGV
jgi:anti-repressor protein